MELYAIVRPGSGDYLWAGLATAEQAQAKAVIAAVNGGTVNLLSGLDLAAHIIDWKGP